MMADAQRRLPSSILQAFLTHFDLASFFGAVAPRGFTPSSEPLVSYFGRHSLLRITTYIGRAAHLREKEISHASTQEPPTVLQPDLYGKHRSRRVLRAYACTDICRGEG